MKYCWLKIVPAQQKVKHLLSAGQLPTVGTEKGVLEKAANAVIGADVEALAVCLRVAIVALYLTVTGEGGVRRDAVHGVILARLPRYSLGQSGQLLAETWRARSPVQGEQGVLAGHDSRQVNCQS